MQHAALTKHDAKGGASTQKAPLSIDQERVLTDRKHDSTSATRRKAPLSIDGERMLMDRLNGEDAVKSALDAMVQQLRSTHAASTSDAVRQLLDRLDRNYDGRLQRSELYAGLLELGLHPVSSDVDAVMRFLDTKQTGSVDYMEL